jgi:hypothetical protein
MTTTNHYGEARDILNKTGRSAPVPASMTSPQRKYTPCSRSQTS